MLNVDPLYEALRLSLPSTLDLLQERKPSWRILQWYVDGMIGISWSSVCLRRLRLTILVRDVGGVVRNMVGRLLVLSGDDLREFVVETPGWEECEEWDDMVDKTVDLMGLGGLEVLELGWMVREDVLRKVVCASGKFLKILKVQKGCMPGGLDWKYVVPGLKVLNVAESLFNQYDLLGITECAIEELDISHCAISKCEGEDIGEFLLALPLLVGLKRLDLSGMTSIRIEDVLLPLRNSNIEELFLRHISVACMEDLVSVLPVELKLLDLSWSWGVDITYLMRHNSNVNLPSRLRYLALHECRVPNNSMISTLDLITYERHYGCNVGDLIFLDISFLTRSQMSAALLLIKYNQHCLETLIAQNVNPAKIGGWGAFEKLHTLSAPFFQEQSVDPRNHSGNFGRSWPPPRLRCLNLNGRIFYGSSEQIECLSNLGGQLEMLHIKGWRLDQEASFIIATKLPILKVLNVSGCILDRSSYQILKRGCANHPTLHTVITDEEDWPLYTRFTAHLSEVVDEDFLLDSKESPLAPHSEEIVALLQTKEDADSRSLKEDGRLFYVEMEENDKVNRYYYSVEELLSIRKENEAICSTVRKRLVLSWSFESEEIIAHDRNGHPYIELDDQVDDT